MSTFGTIDSFDQNGLQTKSFNQLVYDIINGYNGLPGLVNIYGADINVNSNSPDAQMVNIFAQAAIDVRELLTSINSSFDPDQSIGVTLDQRFALKNRVRQAGLYTLVPIDIKVTQTVTLQGLDSDADNPNGTGFTVQDNAGNLYILLNSVTLTSGTTTETFRAQNIGNVEVTTDTITTVTTITLGVSSVTNSQNVLQQGTDEELDGAFRVRGDQTTSIDAQNSCDAMRTALLNLGDVTNAIVNENVEDDPDSNGIPGHGIWVIVEGGDNVDIANIIYANSCGVNMKGGTSQVLVTASGSNFTAYFDVPHLIPLYIKSDIKRTNTNITIDTNAIKNFLINTDNLSYTLNEYAETSKITDALKAAIQSTSGGAVAVNVSISSNGVSYTDFINTPVLNDVWNIVSTNISLNVI